jgi:hypothetical protein
MLYLCKVISEFGRFPHRNRILGRYSTEREAEFLGNLSFRFDLPIKKDLSGFSSTARFDNSDEYTWDFGV